MSSAYFPDGLIKRIQQSLRKQAVVDYGDGGGSDGAGVGGGVSANNYVCLPHKQIWLSNSTAMESTYYANACTDLFGASMTGSSLARLETKGNAILNYVNFDDANLTDAKLDGALMCRTSLRGTKLKSTSFGGTVLVAATIEPTLAVDVSLTSANAALARFEGRWVRPDLADLSAVGSILRKLQLFAPQLEDSLWYGAQFVEVTVYTDSTTFWPDFALASASNVKVLPSAEGARILQSDEKVMTEEKESVRNYIDRNANYFEREMEISQSPFYAEYRADLSAVLQSLPPPGGKRIQEVTNFMSDRACRSPAFASAAIAAMLDTSWVTYEAQLNSGRESAPSWPGEKCFCKGGSDREIVIDKLLERQFGKTLPPNTSEAERSRRSAAISISDDRSRDHLPFDREKFIGSITSSECKGVQRLRALWQKLGLPDLIAEVESQTK